MRQGHLLSQKDVDLLNAIRPRCARCNRLVGSISWSRRIAERKVNFKVGCHGKTESFSVEFDELSDYIGDKVAFALPILKGQPQ